MYGYLIYIAPKISFKSIWNTGILPPKQVRELIERNKLSKEVLGTSYGQAHSSFPKHVSLLRDEKGIQEVVDQLYAAHVELNGATQLNYVVYTIKGYYLNQKLFLDPQHPRKKDESLCETNDFCTSEVLYEGKVKRDTILSVEFRCKEN